MNIFFGTHQIDQQNIGSFVNGNAKMRLPLATLSQQMCHDDGTMATKTDLEPQKNDTLE